MKVLAVSDTVNKLLYSPQVKRLAGNVDLIVSCGDLPAYYLDFLVSTLGKPLFYICGNHDNYETKEQNLRSELSDARSFYSTQLDYVNTLNFGGNNLDRKVVDFRGALFAGLEGSFRYNKGDHQYNEAQMRRHIAKMGPKLFWNRVRFKKSVDVLITHASPRGIHDKDDNAHRGFESYLRFIEKYRPKYLLHGHIHIYDRREERITEYKGTQIINCYDYQILDLDLNERE